MYLVEALSFDIVRRLTYSRYSGHFVEINDGEECCYLVTVQVDLDPCVD